MNIKFEQSISKSGKPGSVSHLTDGLTVRNLAQADRHTLHDIEERLRANSLQRKRLERQFYLNTLDDTSIGG